MLDDARRQQIIDDLHATTMKLTRSVRDDVEVQLFGYGMRLVPPDAGLILNWFLPPEHDDLIFSVSPTDDWWREEPTWYIPAAAPDATGQVAQLLQAGLAGDVAIQRSRHRHYATAHLAEGTQTSHELRRSWLDRLLLRDTGPETRRYPAFPRGTGHVHLRDVAAPPPLMSGIAEAIAPSVLAAGLTLRRTFSAAGIHGLPTDSGGSVFGWGAQIDRPDGSTALWVWFDGFDEDLAVMVADRYWFEWFELDDSAAVTDEVAGVVAAALSGRITPGPRNTATARLSDGRTVSTSPPPPGSERS